MLRAFAQGLINNNKPLRARSLKDHSSAFMSLTETTGKGAEADCVVLLPRDKAYQNVVLFMHGLGDTAAGWSQAMPQLGLAKTKFILPTAPIRPITMAQGYAMNGWSDIFAIAPGTREDEDGFNASTARLQAMIDQEKAKGIPTEKIIVAGFSQGGALALHLAMRAADHLGGVVCMSSWLPLAESYPDKMGPGMQAGFRILQCHGDVDNVVQYSWGKQSHEKLKDLGLKAEFETYSGLGHSANQAEMTRVADFMRKQFDKSA